MLHTFIHILFVTFHTASARSKCIVIVPDSIFDFYMHLHLHIVHVYMKWYWVNVLYFTYSKCTISVIIALFR